MSDRFAACLPYVLAQECPFPKDWSNPKNFSNDAHDPGGKTMCGLTQREYDHWRKSCSESTRDVREITQDEGTKLYQEVYWYPYCAELPPGLDLAFFDSAVNEGTTEAVKILQYALGIVSDGLWGDATAHAVESITHVQVIIAAFTARRAVVYRMSKGFQYFGKDWERRAGEIGTTSLTMVA